MNKKTNFFKEFNQIDDLKVFSERMYSIELLVLLVHRDCFSITQLYNNIFGNKPRIDAFNNYLNRLIQSGVCTKERSKTNKSEVIIKLNITTHSKVKELFDRHGFLQNH